MRKVASPWEAAHWDGITLALTELRPLELLLVLQI